MLLLWEAAVRGRRPGAAYMCLCIAGRPTSPRRRLGAPKRAENQVFALPLSSSDERVLHKQHTQ